MNMYKKKNSCDIGMHFGNFRDNSVNIGNDEKASDVFCLT